MKKRAAPPRKKRTLIFIFVVGAIAIFQFDAIVRTTVAVSSAQIVHTSLQSGIPKNDGTPEKPRLSENAQ
jgi:hypothetical protein